LSEHLREIDNLTNLPKQELVARLMEAESALEAIRAGEVDAFIVPGPTTDHIYTLKDADHPYRLLVEEMNEGAVTLIDDTILYSNQCFARMLKHPLEKIIGSSFFEYLPSDELIKFKELFKEIKQGNIVRSEFNIVAGDSSFVQVQIAVNAMVFDGFSGHCLIINDITDLKLKDAEIIIRKERENILSENQQQLKELSAKLEQSNKDLQRFALIIESSDDAIISKDLKGIISSWNNGAERIFGYKAEEVIGKAVNILIPKDRQNEEPAILQRIIQGERIDHYDTLRQRKDGSLVDISLTISPIRNADGDIIGASKIAHDITERKKAEQDLQKLTSLLEERVVERTQVLEDQAKRLRLLAVELTEVEQKERRRLAEVLHDHLQQYLVATKMRLELIERRGSSDAGGFEEARSYIDKAIDASRHLTAELRPSVLYEGGLRAGLRYLRQKTEDRHKIRVHLVLSDDIEPSTDLIKILLYQCIQELLFNTVKYAGVSECFVTVSRLENRNIEVIVEDKGVGFNVTNLGNNDKGGFGLFSIRERIKALGGEFKVSSFPHEGSIFTITVPDTEMSITLEENLSKEKTAFSKKSDKDGIVVLIADDHLIVRQAIANLLLAQPFIKEVIEAGNGEEAIRKAESADPDIILMDINMPTMNGIEATQILCRSNPSLKIIGLSVQHEAEMARAMKDVGAVAYFNKGDDTNSLIETIKNFAFQQFPSI